MIEKPASGAGFDELLFSFGKAVHDVARQNDPRALATVRLVEATYAHQIRHTLNELMEISRCPTSEISDLNQTSSERPD